MKYQTNLKFWVDKLKAGEKFSMARWGDGELYCMWGKKGANSNGCNYYPELREELIKAMTPKTGFYHGLQRVLPRDEERITREYPDITWYETETFSEAVAEGKLYPLIEQLKKMRVVLIGNESLTPVARMLGSGLIIVPKSNTFDVREDVIKAITLLKDKDKETVFAFSCGMAANVFIYQLHDGVNWFIDLGHIWDPFTGLMSRCDLEGKTLEDINKNLKPCEQ